MVKSDFHQNSSIFAQKLWKREISQCTVFAENVKETDEITVFCAEWIILLVIIWKIHYFGFHLDYKLQIIGLQKRMFQNKWFS